MCDVRTGKLLIAMKGLEPFNEYHLVTPSMKGVIDEANPHSILALA